MKNQIEIGAGIQQVVLPNQTISSTDFQSISYRNSINAFGIPLSVSGKVGFVNGVFLTQASGISIQFDKSRLKNLESKKSKLDSIQNKLNGLPTKLPDVSDSSIIEKLDLPLDIDRKLRLDSQLLDKVCDSIALKIKILELDSIKIPESKLVQLNNLKDSLSYYNNYKTKYNQYKNKFGNLISDNRISNLNSKNFIDSLNFNIKNEISDSLLEAKDKLISGNPKKVKKLNLKQINNFNIGLGSLNFSNLLATGTTYQGLGISFELDSTCEISPVVGITNRFPSLTQLIRQPQLLNSFNGNTSISQVSGLSNQNVNSLIFNQDLINIFSSNYFAGANFRKRISQGMEYRINYYYSSTAQSDNSRQISANLSSIEFLKVDKFYKFSVEIANSVIRNNTSLTNDSLTNINFIKDSNLALAIHSKGEFTISKNLNVNFSYRNLSNLFYSPLQLFNNNIVNKLGFGADYGFLNKKIKFSSELSTGQIRTGIGNKPIRTLNQSLNIQPRESLSFFANGNYSLIGDSITNAINYNFNLGFDFSPRKNKFLNINTSLIYYRYDQILQTNLLLNKFLGINSNITYAFPSKNKIIYINEVGFLDDVNLISNRFQYFIFNFHKLNLIPGISHLQLNRKYWINLGLGIQYLENKRISFSFNLERTIYSTDQPLFNGNLRLTANF